MPPAKRDPASILDAILDRVPRMREYGVLSVAHEGLTVTLAPMAPPPYVINDRLDRQLEEKVKRRVAASDADEDEKPPEDTADPLNDRATYAGGRVPGFTRPKKEQA